MITMAFLSLPFPTSLSQRMRIRGCNQQLVQRGKAKDIAEDMFRSTNEAKEQLTFQPVTLMLGAVGSGQSDNDEEDLIFDAEYGVASGESTVTRHIDEISGPMMVYYLMLLEGDYQSANDYIQNKIEEGRVEDKWNQQYHDDCSVIAERLAKDIANIETFVAKDKDSAIEG